MAQRTITYVFLSKTCAYIGWISQCNILGAVKVLLGCTWHHMTEAMLLVKSKAFLSAGNISPFSCTFNPKTYLLYRPPTWPSCHVVMLQIKSMWYRKKFVIYKALFLNPKRRNSEIIFLLAVKRNHLSTRVMARTVQLLRHDANCPIKLSY